MLYCTHHRNCTLTTMYAMISYHVTLYSMDYYITVIQMLTIM